MTARSWGYRTTGPRGAGDFERWFYEETRLRAVDRAIHHSRSSESPRASGEASFEPLEPRRTLRRRGARPQRRPSAASAPRPGPLPAVRRRDRALAANRHERGRRRPSLRPRPSPLHAPPRSAADTHADRPWREYTEPALSATSTSAAHRGARPLFDVVICEQVLEHVPDPWLGSATYATSASPAAMSIVSTPFLVRIHEWPIST